MEKMKENEAKEILEGEAQWDSVHGSMMTSGRLPAQPVPQLALYNVNRLCMCSVPRFIHSATNAAQ